MKRFKDGATSRGGIAQQNGSAGIGLHGIPLRLKPEGADIGHPIEIGLCTSGL